MRMKGICINQSSFHYRHQVARAIKFNLYLLECLTARCPTREQRISKKKNFQVKAAIEGGKGSVLSLSPINQSSPCLQEPAQSGFPKNFPFWGSVSQATHKKTGKDLIGNTPTTPKPSKQEQPRPTVRERHQSGAATSVCYRPRLFRENNTPHSLSHPHTNTPTHSTHNNTNNTPWVCTCTMLGCGISSPDCLARRQSWSWLADTAPLSSAREAWR